MAKCRICGQDLSDELFILKNVPSGAQVFLDKASLSQDNPIDMTLCQCRCCGVIQLVGEPVSYWRKVIRASGISQSMCAFRRKQFREYVEKYDLLNKNILEIGAASGEFVSIMSQVGAKAEGIEFDNNLVQKASEKKLNVKKFIFETGKERLEKKYDGFFMLNWLEHLPNLPAFFNALKNNITENAVGLIEVPNSEKILEKGQISELIQDHLYYFTQKTFVRVLEMFGFEVLSINKILDNYVLSAVIKQRKLYDTTLLNEKYLSYKKAFNNLINSFNSVAVWGAGHQSLTALSMLDYIHKVSFVIDSADFKQNKYTPVTHLPIVSPDILKQKKVEAVIVAVGSYNNEVIDFLKKEYKNSFKVYMLDESGDGVEV